MEPNYYDALNWNTDKDITKKIGKEIIYYSNKVQKINSYSMKQDRGLLLTDHCLYNLQNKTIKRQMKYEEMLGITFSSTTNEFVVHAKKGHDFHFLSPDKIYIIYIIAKCYEKFSKKPLILCKVKDKSLKQYVTTKKEKRKDSNTSKLDDENIIDTLTFIIDNNPFEKSKRASRELSRGNLSIIQENQTQINQKLLFSNDSKIQSIGYEDFNIIKISGRGISGKVFLAENKLNKQYYALKTLEKKCFDIEFSELEKMKELTKKLAFPFLINIDFCFETDERIYFACPYIQGEELIYNINMNNNLDEEKVKFYSGIIGLTLDYLYNNGINYKSFSSKNIIIDKDGYLKLMPFNIGKIFQIKKSDKNKFKKNIEKYKNEYSPPELFLENKIQNSKSAYCWNLGILIFEMIYGIPPFYTNIDAKMKEIITKNEIIFPETPTISQNLQDLLSQLLNKNYKDRLGHQNGFEDIKKHIFFKGCDFEKLLEKKLKAPYKPSIGNILEGNKQLEEKFIYEDLKKYDDLKYN
jgi:serum/glucocorticoid-regulated kinase 2